MGRSEEVAWDMMTLQIRKQLEKAFFRRSPFIEKPLSRNCIVIFCRGNSVGILVVAPSYLSKNSIPAGTVKALYHSRLECETPPAKG